MKKTIWLFLFLIFNTGCSEPHKDETPAYVHYDINFNEIAPDEIYQAARAGMLAFYNLQPSQFTLGTAFRDYYIQPAALSNCNPPNVAWLLAYNANIWHVVAVVDNSTSYLLDIDGGTLASTGSAQAYINLTQQLKALYPQYTPIFISGKEGEFFFFPEINDSNLTWIQHSPPETSELQNLKTLPEAMAYMNSSCTGT